MFIQRAGVAQQVPYYFDMRFANTEAVFPNGELRGDRPAQRLYARLSNCQPHL